MKRLSKFCNTQQNKSPRYKSEVIYTQKKFQIKFHLKMMIFGLVLESSFLKTPSLNRKMNRINRIFKLGTQNYNPFSRKHCYLLFNLTLTQYSTFIFQKVWNSEPIYVLDWVILAYFGPMSYFYTHYPPLVFWRFDGV